MTASLALRKAAQTLLAPLIAVVAAVLVTSVVVTIAGASVSDFWSVLTTAPSGRNWVNIVNQTSMIFLAALAAAIGFRMNLFNIGVEGQYTIASYAAALVAGFAIFPGKLNVVVAVLVAVVTGALWAGIAGLLKVTRGVSEVISTIMLNAIAGTLVGYLLSNHGDQYGQGRRTTPIPESSQFAGWTFFGARDGAVWTLALLAVAAGVLVSFLINRTRFGFDLRATGQNEDAAVASGVQVKKMVVVSMLLSGGIAGLIWMPALFGGADYYGPPFQHQLGFTGIAVALLGRNRPLGIFFGAVLFAWLSEQANPLGLIADISPSIVQITQGVVVLAVVIAYEVVRRWIAASEQRALRATLDQAAPAGDEKKEVTA
ncbi:ABC transporter permease [Nocardioides sp. KIGAM211]|uniref:ABC transporter permease n=1 Tax=Nocardioides luti TaxID=2761101 RepID=A0A7X0VD40_9ACTN|nr:ABC transporter permease [Nocardioides luti]MBB6628903.1 ABC transporter permease [Nocardioides luti]